MHEELIKQLRELPHLLFVQLGGQENIVYQAADAIEKLEQENAFLKTMQKQLASGIPSEDLGRMVARGLRSARR